MAVIKMNHSKQIIIKFPKKNLKYIVYHHIFELENEIRRNFNSYHYYDVIYLSLVNYFEMKHSHC